MKIRRIASTAGVFVAGFALALSAVQMSAQQAKAPQPARHTIDMTPVKPESEGFSSERLERLHAAWKATVDQKRFAGYVTILARRGKIVDYQTYGDRDMASGTPMTKDTIFRDYSMTKPLTAVAMMILYEEGKWVPLDPVSKFIPEFKHLKVFNGVDANGKMILVDPDHEPTMGELLTHTAGFGPGKGGTPADKMYSELKVSESQNLQEMIDRLAQIPLMYQPGKAWLYSISGDIEGYIVEKLSGQTLPDFMRDHIFQPLGMRHAGFYVPAEERSRLATLYENDQHGGLELDPTNGGVHDFREQPTRPSGGGGLVSTAEDYYRFAQMLANGGELNGKRILAPATVKLMTSNHLPDSLLTGQWGNRGALQMRPGFGYGYNFAVVFDPPEANMVDGKGTFYWGGAAETMFWVDPTNDIVFVGMVQRMKGGTPDMRILSHPLVDQALVNPQK